jgi:glutaminyl-peptide cyclotransferase
MNMPRNRSLIIAAVSLLVIGVGLAIIFRPAPPVDYGDSFDGERAYVDAAYQMSLGPRLPGSDAHFQIVEWMVGSLKSYGWAVEIQEAEMLGHPIQNIIAKRGSGGPWVIVGAHYDNRFVADHDPDPDRHDEPVPGANDGASGVAVLMELARVLPEDINGQIWLVFFDAEDNGGIESWDWILGSTAFVDSLVAQPEAALILDMIGDADLQIYLETNSDPQISAEIWQHAAELGYENVFINEQKFSMLDDHTPFLRAGIPAVDIIDFDYPYWHTVEDTLDKISAQSLQAVGDTMLAWLLAQ